MLEISRNNENNISNQNNILLEGDKKWSKVIKIMNVERKWSNIKEKQSNISDNQITSMIDNIETNLPEITVQEDRVELEDKNNEKEGEETSWDKWKEMMEDENYENIDKEEREVKPTEIIVQMKGRLKGVSMARKLSAPGGRKLYIQSHKRVIEYKQNYIMTKWGNIGIKVWRLPIDET